MVRTRSAFLLASLSLLCAATAWADGDILDGLNARSIGRGGTNVAHSDNAALIADNPAGMVNIDSQRLLEFGVTSMITDFGYADPQNARSYDVEFVPLPEFGFIRRSADGQWAFGLGAFALAGFKESYYLQGPLAFGGPQDYESFGALAKILPSIAYRVDDRLSIGGALGVGISYAELKGPYIIQGPNFLQGAPAMMNMHGTGAALVWSFGLQYQLTDATTIGATYQSESRFHLGGTTDVVIPAMVDTSYSSSVDMVWPQSVSLGLRHAMCRHHVFSADVIWTDWTKAYDTMGIHLNESSVVGLPPLYEEFPLHWRDTVSLRLGYEWFFAPGQTLRLGYVHHRNPMPQDTMTPWIQAMLEHAFSIGYGCQVRSWEFDFAYMYSFSPGVQTGTSSLIGGDFSDALHEARTHAIAISATRKF